MDGDVMKEFTLKVSPQELQVLVGAMHESGPYKVIAPLLYKLQAQITEQETASEANIPKKPSCKSGKA